MSSSTFSLGYVSNTAGLSEENPASSEEKGPSISIACKELPS